ncbi:DUF4232 domain-containing protein [Streptomyces sp. NPDC056039]|uniref:DUF4232 domain-containing protein n=1 Tax=Streptomyces sp. NPDC056039 TaxID=3345687 RepID=UPI0035D5F027
MNRRLRTALAVTAVIGSGLLMTACGGGDESSASDSPAASSSQASPTASGGSGDSGTSKSTGGGSSDKSGTSGDSADGDSSGDKKGYGQSCGTNDISWSVSSEDQAGGYFLIKATAKSGITCVLPAELPVVAFGSDGTEAEPAEQSAGRPITLREGVTAYAGVNPKTTNGDTGKELDSLIVSVSNDDPNPESLKVDSYVVDKPIVTSWHTSPTDAVPFSG